nr:hypothetical protein [uncultured Sellimonas sp.]
MVENFIWAFEQLNHEDIMGIYGGAHTEIDSDVEYSYFVPDPNMASQLNKKYPNTIHTKLLAKGYDDSTPWKTGSLEIGGKEYPSILWNEIWIKSTKTSYDSVKVWELKEGSEDFKDIPTGTQTISDYDVEFPIPMKYGKIYVLDFYTDDIFKERKIFRSDSNVTEKGNIIARELLYE